MGNRRRLPGEGSIRLRKDGRWEARVSVGSREDRKPLSAYARTQDDALDELAALRRRAGLYVGPTDPEHQFVGQYLDWWVDVELPGQVAEGTLAVTTAETYETHIRLRIKPLLGHLRLRRLNAQHIRGMMRKLAADGLAAGTRAVVLSTLSAALKVAWRDLEIIDENPARKVAAPKVKQRKPPPLPLDDARKIIDAVRHPQHARLEALWTAPLFVGLRPGEATGWCWDQIDFDDRVLTVSRNLVRVKVEKGRYGWRLHDTKGHKTRHVALPRLAIDLLRTRRRVQLEERLAAGELWQPERVFDAEGRDCGGDLVFTTDVGKPLYRGYVSAELDRICRRAGVPRLTPHQYMRHGGATLLLALGVDLMTIRDVLGHYSIDMTEVYAHVLDEAMRDAADRMDRAFGHDE